MLGRRLHAACTTRALNEHGGKGLQGLALGQEPTGKGARTRRQVLMRERAGLRPKEEAEARGSTRAWGILIPGGGVLFTTK